MEMFWILLAGVVAAGAGVVVTRRQRTSVDDPTGAGAGVGADGGVFRQESVADRIAQLVTEIRHLKTGFLVIASFGVVLLAIAGVMTVQGHIDAPPVWFVIAGLLFGALPAGALQLVGHTIPGLLIKPTIPAHLRTPANDHGGADGDVVADVDGEWDEERKWPAWVTLTLGAVALVGAALFALQHLMATAEMLGFDEDIPTPFGPLPSRALLPAMVEILQGYLLGAIVVKTIDLARLRSEAAEVRQRELEHEIHQQRMETDLTARRLTADAEHAEAKAMAGIRRREVEQAAALEEAKREAAAATLVESAQRQAVAELGLEEQEQQARVAIKQAEISGRVAQAEGEHQLRQAQIAQEIEVKHIEAEAETMRLRASADLARRQAKAQAKVTAARAEAEEKRLTAAAELEVVKAKAEADLAKQRAKAELSRAAARHRLELEAENQRMEIEFELENLEAEQRLLHQRQRITAVKAAIEAGEPLPPLPAPIPPTAAVVPSTSGTVTDPKELIAPDPGEPTSVMYTSNGDGIGGGR